MIINKPMNRQQLKSLGLNEDEIKYYSSYDLEDQTYYLTLNGF